MLPLPSSVPPTTRPTSDPALEEQSISWPSVVWTPEYVPFVTFNEMLVPVAAEPPNGPSAPKLRVLSRQQRTSAVRKTRALRRPALRGDIAIDCRVPETEISVEKGLDRRPCKFTSVELRTSFAGFGSAEV